MNRIFTRLGFTAVAIVAGSGIVAHAQTATTGAVNGVVSDSKGAPIAGATIRLSSNQTQRTAVTGADGSFRLGLLNPGAWTLEVTKAGLQKFNQSVSVLVNQTQPFSIKLVSEASTVVEVLGAATSIDNTTAQTGLVTSLDTISAIPKNSRDMSAVTFLAPGVVTGGFGQDPSIGGGSSAENSYIVDGLSTTNTARGFQGATLVTDFIDQVEVQTGGFKPEFSALGGVVNAVTKSGGNEFKGSAWLTWDPIGIAAKPKKGDYYRQNSFPTRYDIGAEVGGPIIKDKLFFFAGVDAAKTETNPANNPTNNNGLTDGKQTIDDVQFISKINYLITQDQSLSFTLNINNKNNDFPLANPNVGDASLGYKLVDTVQNFVLNYDWTISPSLFFSAKLGSTQYEEKETPTDSTRVAVTDYRWLAFGPGSTSALGGSGYAWRYGGAGYYVGDDKTKTTQFKFDLSWFLGSHNMKFGFSNISSDYTEIARTSGGHRDTITAGTSPTAQTSLYQYYLSTDATVKAEFQALYAQDTWDVGSGLKLMYGIRYETQKQKDYQGNTFMKFTDFKDQVQPRLGFTWDVNGDGKSKFSGSYAKYFESIPQRIAIRVFANETYIRYRYAGSQYTYDNATGAYALIPGAVYNRVTDYATPFTNDPIAVGTKLPERNEYILGYDHAFASGWTAGIHAKYRELKNPIEDMVFTDPTGAPYDEGPQIDYVNTPSRYGAGAAVLGNPGGFMQWRPNPNSMTLYLLGLGLANPNGAGPGYSYNSYGINMLNYYNPATGLFTVQDTQFPKAGNKYSSVDFTLEKKTDRSVFNFSYTWSRLEGNYEGVVSSSNGQADGNITASYDYYPYVGYGLLPNDRTHVAKLFASHRFDFFGGDLSLGASWTYQSGIPVSKFDNTNDIGGYGNATPLDGQLGQLGRTPARNNVDTHIDWTYKVGKTFRVIPSIDMFNMFNTRYATAYLEQSTDNTGVPLTQYGTGTTATNWQQGRRYRFGVKVQF